MRTEHLLLFCVLVCQTTERLTDKRVNLGQNVTLDCPLDVKEIYWVFQKPTDSPVLILRTYSSESSSPLVLDQRLKDKYSSITLSRLFISNLTMNELGIYYCSKTGSHLQLSNGTRLHITEEAAPDHNQTEVKNTSQCTNTQQSLIVLYFIPYIVMVLAIIGLLQIRLQECKKTRRQYEDEELKHVYNTNDEEFSEAKFRLFHPTNNTFVPFQKPKTKCRRL